jgi:hypothetical protein
MKTQKIYSFICFFYKKNYLRILKLKGDDHASS